MSFCVSVAPEWDLLSDRFYRRLTLYSALPWSTPAAAAATSSSSGVGGATIGRLDLSTHIVAAAPFGGPIAAVCDDSKIVQVHSEPSTSSRRLLLFSSSAHPIASAPWPPLLPRLHSLAFSNSLSLLALLSDGSLIRFRFPDLQPIPSSSPVPLLPPASGGVADALFWGGGVAILTEDNCVVVVTDIEVDDPHPRHLADPGVGDEEHVRCMAVVDPQFVMSGSPEVLLAVGDRVIAVDEDGMQVLGEDLEIGHVQKMAVSPNGKLLAAFAHDGRLLVIPTDFSRIIFEYECDSALPPEQIVWCGLDIVLLYWPEVLLMVGPNGDPVQYNYDEPIKLIPECDGVRILSNSSMEFLHQVLDSTTLIFGIGSMSPAALLYDARAHYDRQSAKPYDNYQLLSSSLPEAIEACIDAAGHEFDVSQQRTLLRAAKYGLAFCSRFPHERLQEMCKMLRVLNAVRDPEIGMPLTIQQYKLLTATVLIGRLINANQHLLALRISEYLNLNSEVVILHWACEKIAASANLPDTVLLESLLDKLRLCKGISYAAVAAHADNSGRQRLAAMLVDHESQSSKQVDGSEGVQDNALTLVKEEEEYPVPEGSNNVMPKAMQEIAEKFFRCSICQFFVREPAVISCGHMFCVGCVERAMSIVGSSECPMCKQCYNYLPFVCRLIGDLVLKLQSFVGDATGTREANEKVIQPISVYQCSVQLEDVSCVQCQNLLYQPTVLNCGHVFCISCVPFAGDGEIINCPTCGMLHPGGLLAICCDLNNFIQDYFAAAYKARAEKAQPFSGTPLLRETMSHRTKLSSTHVGVGCDFCGVYPIQGDRFTCKTCVNFDLCEKCAKMDTPIAGRSGQQHPLDHTLELNNSFLFSTVLSVLDKKEAEQDGQGSWQWQPARWEAPGGVMQWDPGHQAPEDADGLEEDAVGLEDFASDSEFESDFSD